MALYSEYIYGGGNPSNAIDSYWNTDPVATGFSTDFTKVTAGDSLWGVNAQGVTYSAIGNKSYLLTGGIDYSAAGGMKCELGAVSYTHLTLPTSDLV